MTLALARKYRPRTFREVVGQEHVVRALSNALTQQRLHHAYLLTGTRGVGKTTLARIVAKALNCESGVSATPCGTCSACVEIDGGRFVDLIELDAASNTQVDSMRELLENALYAPTRGRYKVYIIDEVHMLSRSAFNAMLKTLEEPPEHVKFILATTDPQKIPVTVLSRCLQFALKQIPPGIIRGQLEQVLQSENVPHEPAALGLIAQAAQGSMRDSLSLLDQAIAHGGGSVDEGAVRDMLGVVETEYLFRLLELLAARDGRGLLDEASALELRGLSLESALADLASLLHRLAIVQAFPGSVDSDEADAERLRTLGAAFTPEDVQLFYQIAIRGREDLPLAPDEFAGFSMTLLRMLAFLPVAPGDASADAGPTHGNERPRQAGGTSASPASGGVASREQAPGPGPGRLSASSWPDTVAALKLGGMARMLAQHCELEGFEADLLRLVVPETHKHLLDAAYRDKLRTALEERFGKIRVEFRVGTSSGNTLAERESRTREALQSRATAAIEGDAFVRDLVENFDAQIVDGSIRPLQ